MVEEIEKDKSMGLFWESEGGRKKRDQVDKGITKNEWRKHFKKEYITKEENKELNGHEGEEEIIGQNQEESEITREEVREVLRNLKRGKAPGPDGITNKAWKTG